MRGRRGEGVFITFFSSLKCERLEDGYGVRANADQPSKYYSQYQ